MIFYTALYNLVVTTPTVIVGTARLCNNPVKYSRKSKFSKISVKRLEIFWLLPPKASGHPTQTFPFHFKIVSKIPTQKQL
jgi:hypothetical protein